jgi:pyridoxal phosphate enzyme (YggS family)
MIEPDDIAGRIARVRERIAVACGRAGRDPSEVTLVAVSKTHGASAIAAAFRAGITDFGENRVQEGAPKIDELRAAGVSAVWHLVGHLQSNKVRAALGCFDILHGIDSERLAKAISERAAHPVPVYIEVNVADEASKFGVTPDEAPPLAEALRGMSNIALRGLMTVAPQVDDPEDVRPVFRRLRALAADIGVSELSMGMTDDYEVAIEEGSTCVRIGRAIFGPRTYA